MNEAYEYDVIVCHSLKDKQVAVDLFILLMRDGFKVALSDRNIKKSRLMVLMLTPGMFELGWKRVEGFVDTFLASQDSSRQLFPLLVEDCQIPEQLKELSILDWRNKNPEGYRQLLELLKEASPSVEADKS